MGSSLFWPDTRKSQLSNTHHFFVIGYIVRRLFAKIQNYTNFVEAILTPTTTTPTTPTTTTDDATTLMTTPTTPTTPPTTMTMHNPKHLGTYPKPQTAAPLPNIDSPFL